MVGVTPQRHVQWVQGWDLMWVQEKINEKIIRVTPIPTAINCSDIRTKVLSKLYRQNRQGGVHGD